MKTLALSMLAMLAMLATGCSTAPKSDSAREQLHNDSMTSVKDFKARDPSLHDFLHNAYGYAIFPSVGEGAVGVGGAYGHGEVYEQGNRIGYCDMTQGTVGASLGGQTQSELIVFKDAEALNSFKSGNYAFEAKASAVAMKSGAATAAKFEKGIAVFVMSTGGLMGTADVGGQKFSFQPL